MSQTDFSPEAQHYSHPVHGKGRGVCTATFGRPGLRPGKVCHRHVHEQLYPIQETPCLDGTKRIFVRQQHPAERSVPVDKRKPVHTNQRTVRTFRLQHTGLLHTGVQKRIWHDLDRIQSHPNAWQGRHILHINSRQCTSNCKQTSNHKKNCAKQFFNLLKSKNHSHEIEKSFGAKRNTKLGQLLLFYFTAGYKKHQPILFSIGSKYSCFIFSYSNTAPAFGILS